LRILFRWQQELEAPPGVFAVQIINVGPPGAHVILRAEMDLLAALDVCPDVQTGEAAGATIAILGS
jgi:hypothetical protein